MRRLLTVLLVLKCWSLNAQSVTPAIRHEIDSIKQVLETVERDTNYANTLYSWYRAIPRDYDLLQIEPLLQLSDYCEEKLATELHQAEVNFYRYYYAYAVEYLGIHYRYAYNYEMAIKLHYKALELQEQWGTDLEIASAMYNLGRLHQDLGQVDQALLFHDRVLQMNSIKDQGTYARALTEKADILRQKGKHREALSYYFRTIPIYENLDEPWPQSLGMSYVGIGEAYLELSVPDSSDLFLEQGFDILLTVESFAVTGWTLQLWAEMDFRNGRYSDAIAKAKNAVVNAIEGQFLSTEYSSHHTLYKSYKAQNELEKALQAYERYTTIKDSAEALEKAELAMQTNYQYIYEKKALTDSLHIVKKTALLEAQHQQEVSEKESQALLAYTLSGIAILVAGLLWFAYRQKRQNNHNLQEKNRLVVQSLKDKELFMKEIHHRVKNNMQMVSSVLRLKANSTENAEVQFALEDSQTRIYSMALAHQKMYRQDNFKAIELSEYVREIVEMLFNPVSDEHLDEFNFAGEEIYMDVDQAQAVGFIAHELATNSLKYAWPNGGKRILNLSIKQESSTIYIQFSDNGIGLPDTFDYASTKSIGMRLVRSFTQRQLNGEMAFSSHNGAIVNLKFEPRKLD